MGIQSQEVTPTRLTIVMDDGRSFTLTRPQMKARLDTDKADLAKAAPKVIAAMQAALGPECFAPKAFLLEVSPAGSFLNVGFSSDSKETWA